MSAPNHQAPGEPTAAHHPRWGGLRRRWARLGPMLRRRLALPLLARELTQQANRRGTYLTRVIVGSIMYLAALGMLWLYSDGGSGFEVERMSQAGQMLFRLVIVSLFAAVYLLLPATMGAAIAGEKERGCLVLLRLTDLSAWQTILQKYFGRLVPIGGYLLIAMPLLGVSYAFGGLSVLEVGLAGWFLLLAALQVGAFSLMLSCWCRTTSGAVVGAYLLGAALGLGPLALLCAGMALEWIHRFSPLGLLATSHLPPVMLMDQVSEARRFVSLGFVDLLSFQKWGLGWWGTLTVQSLPSLLSTALFLGLARYWLHRRAEAKPTRWLKRIMNAFDRGLKRLNDAWVGGVVLIRDRGDLPTDRPILWRELRRRNLSKFRYLVRLLMALMVPVVLVGVWVIWMLITTGGDTKLADHLTQPLEALTLLNGALAALLLLVASSAAIGAERREQTLAVLLTSPLSGAQILRQKVASLSTLAMMLCVPLLSLTAMRAWVFHVLPTYHWRPSYASGFALLSLGCLVVFPWLLTWFGTLMGLLIRRTAWTTPATLGAALLWLVGPPAVLVALVGPDLESGSAWSAPAQGGPGRTWSAPAQGGPGMTWAVLAVVAAVLGATRVLKRCGRGSVRLGWLLVVSTPLLACLLVLATQSYMGWGYKTLALTLMPGALLWKLAVDPQEIFDHYEGYVVCGWVNLAIHAAALLTLRVGCLMLADWLLGRPTPSDRPGDERAPGFDPANAAANG